MNSGIIPPDVYTDFNRFAGLRNLALDKSSQAVREVASQFETLFLQMMLKSMRDASFGGGIMDNDQSRFFQDLYDKQVSLDITKTSNIGLADLIVKQLETPERFTNESGGSALREYRSNPVSARLRSVDRSGRNEFPGENRAESADQLKVRDDPPINSPEDFVRSLMPYAKKVTSEIGVDPKLIIAQAALETGWGKAIMRQDNGTSSYNLFGIKADSRWHGERVSEMTVEYRHGIAEKSRETFRSYSGYQESFEDYIRFLKSNPRYDTALKSSADPVEFIKSLQAAGYATDPDYADKVINIFERVDFDRARFYDI